MIRKALAEQIHTLIIACVAVVLIVGFVVIVLSGHSEEATPLKDLLLLTVGGGLGVAGIKAKTSSGADE